MRAGRVLPKYSIGHSFWLPSTHYDTCTCSILSSSMHPSHLHIVGCTSPGSMLISSGPTGEPPRHTDPSLLNLKSQKTSSKMGIYFIDAIACFEFGLDIFPTISPPLQKYQTTPRNASQAVAKVKIENKNSKNARSHRV